MNRINRINSVNSKKVRGRLLKIEKTLDFGDIPFILFIPVK
jgi:hypothetical protein